MHSILIVILKIGYSILINPVFWISFMGPRIISMNFKFLRGRLGINYNDEQSPPELRDLHNVINKNIWVYAWNDFNAQLFVTLMSFFFVVIESAKIVFELCRKYGTDISFSRLSDSNSTLIMLILLIALFLSSLFIFMGDKLISVDILRKYQPHGGIITGEDKNPPWTLLTYYRGGLLIFGLLYSLWQAFILPDILSEIELASKSLQH